MSLYNLAWVVLLVPVGAIAASYVVETPRRAAAVVAGGSGVALVAAAVLLGYRLGHNGDNPYQSLLTFWTYEPGQLATGSPADFHPSLGILVDGLAVALLPVVALGGLLVQVHAIGYLRADPGVRRFAVVSGAAVTAALALVASPTLFQALLAAGVLGGTVLLLAGHWWHRDDVTAGALRAYLVGLPGEIALLLAVVIGWLKLAPDVALLPAAPGLPFDDPFDIPLLAGAEWPRLANGVVLGSGRRTLELLACLVLVAVLARAAQLPFAGWLDAAASGPIPGLATVLVAGPPLVAVVLALRFLPLLELAPHVLTALGLVAALSALVAAAGALVERDVKRLVVRLVAAHLGIALVGVGFGDASAATAVAATTALWGAALLLLFGAVVRAYGTQDIEEMGGVARRMPRTALGLLAATAAAAALPPLGGFWGPEGVLAAVFRDRLPLGGQVSRPAETVIAVVSVVALALASAAAVRLYVTAVPGDPRRRRGFVAERVREAPVLLRLPGIALAVVAAAAGLLAVEGLRVNLSHLVVPSSGDPGYPARLDAVVVVGLATLAGAALTLAARRGALPAVPASLRSAVAARPLDAGIDWLAARAVAVAPLLVGAGERGVVGPVTAALDDVLEVAGAAASQVSTRRLGTQVVAATTAALLLAGAVTLAASGHLPGVGGAR